MYYKASIVVRWWWRWGNAHKIVIIVFEKNKFGGVTFIWNIKKTKSTESEFRICVSCVCFTGASAMVLHSL